MSTEPVPAPFLVLGLGNPLLHDDGVGLEVLRVLEARSAGDERVDFVDGGTQGMALMGLLEGRRATLLLDAERRGGPPGSVHFSPDPQRFAGSRGLSVHEGNAFELLAAVQLAGIETGPVLLVGIEPLVLRIGVGLSPPVVEAVPRAVALARRLLDELLAGRQVHEVSQGVRCTS